jgi:hypothetical protein
MQQWALALVLLEFFFGYLSAKRFSLTFSPFQTKIKMSAPVSLTFFSVLSETLFVYIFPVSNEKLK